MAHYFSAVSKRNLTSFSSNVLSLCYKFKHFTCMLQLHECNFRREVALKMHVLLCQRFNPGVF